MKAADGLSSMINKQLIEAARDNKLQDVISLLSKGANINWQDPNDVS